MSAVSILHMLGWMRHSHALDRTEPNLLLRHLRQSYLLLSYLQLQLQLLHLLRLRHLLLA